MTDLRETKIQEAAQQVAYAITCNRIAVSDISRVFAEAEKYLYTCFAPGRQEQPPEDDDGRFTLQPGEYPQAEPEKAVDSGLQCLCQHFAAWYAALKNGETPDFATPCTSCSNLESCGRERFPWYDKIIPILESQGVQIGLTAQKDT